MPERQKRAFYSVDSGPLNFRFMVFDPITVQTGLGVQTRPDRVQTVQTGRGHPFQERHGVAHLSATTSIPLLNLN